MNSYIVNFCLLCLTNLTLFKWKGQEMGRRSNWEQICVLLVHRSVSMRLRSLNLLLKMRRLVNNTKIMNCYSKIFDTDIKYFDSYILFHFHYLPQLVSVYLTFSTFKSKNYVKNLLFSSTNNQYNNLNPLYQKQPIYPLPQALPLQSSNPTKIDPENPQP